MPNYIDDTPRPKFHEWVQQGRAVHGDKFEYLGTKTDGSRTCLVIRCPEHGVQSTTVYKHLNGIGCPACGKAMRDKAKELGFDEWVRRSKLVHGDRYEYKCLSKSGATTDITYYCKRHGEVTQSAYRHSKGVGCFSCGIETSADAKRLSLAEWKERALAVHGARYEYIGMHTKDGKTVLSMVCKEHGKFDQLGFNHLNGHKCPKCSRQSAKEALRVPISTVASRLAESHSEDLELLGVDYTDNGTYLRLSCAEGHGVFSSSMGSVLGGTGCPDCGKDKSAAERSLSVSEVAQQLAVHDRLEVVELDRSEGRIIVTTLCGAGHMASASLPAVRRSGCVECTRLARIEGMKLKLEDYTPRFRELHGESYTYLAIMHENSVAYVLYSCSEHGDILQQVNGHLKGFGCSKCTVSGVMGNKHTREIADYLRSLGLSVLEEHSFGSERKRWDIVVPEAKVAIEFDGTYYHSEKFKSDRSAMRNKARVAESHGFRQINIWEDEWYSKKGIVKRLIASAARVPSSGKVYARITDVRAVAKPIAESFLNDNHIQGFVPGGHYVGLYNGDDLVACMVYTYKAPGRDATAVEDSVEIQRYATSTSVVGGFQKLLACVLKDSKVSTVFSYSDPRQFSGAMYRLAGFAPSEEGDPDYCYVRGGVRIPKRARQKSWFKGREGVVFGPDMTESELAQANGYLRLWYRGKVRWTLTRPAS